MESMTKKEYELLLKKAPEHNSSEFIQFLKDNNVVVGETNHWLTIRNAKYWTPENDWLTCFYVPNNENPSPERLNILFNFFRDREWLKKDTKKQTVERFHMHFYLNNYEKSRTKIPALRKTNGETSRTRRSRHK